LGLNRELEPIILAAPGHSPTAFCPIPLWASDEFDPLYRHNLFDCLKLLPAQGRKNRAGQQIVADTTEVAEYLDVSIITRSVSHESRFVESG
jgi:hypothetical protein